jgi:DNA polymerase III subunit beta
MKLSIDRDALADALKRAAAVVETRNLIPILANLKLTATADTLSIVGTNMDREVTVRVEADVARGGATTVPAALVRDFVARLPKGGRMEIEDDGAGRCTMCCGRANTRLGTLPIGDFPAMVGPQKPVRFTMPADRLGAMLATAAPFATTDDSRYCLKGVYLHVDGDRLIAVATDGNRLAKVETEAPDGASDMPGVIVPADAVAVLMSTLRGLSGPVTVEATDVKLAVEAGTLRLVTKLVDGHFPDYGRVIPRWPAARTAVRGSVLRSAVERVNLLAEGKGRLINLDVDVGSLLLSSKNDAHRIDEEIEVSHGGAPMKLAANASYLTGALQAIGDADLEIGFTDPASPFLIRRLDDDRSLFLIMPMRRSA